MYHKNNGLFLDDLDLKCNQKPISSRFDFSFSTNACFIDRVKLIFYWFAVYQKFIVVLIYEMVIDYKNLQVYSSCFRLNQYQGVKLIYCTNSACKIQICVAHNAWGIYN